MAATPTTRAELSNTGAPSPSSEAGVLDINIVLAIDINDIVNPLRAAETTAAIESLKNRRAGKRRGCEIISLREALAEAEPASTPKSKRRPSEVIGLLEALADDNPKVTSSAPRLGIRRTSLLDALVEMDADRECGESEFARGTAY